MKILITTIADTHLLAHLQAAQPTTQNQSLQKSQQVSSPKKNFKIFSRHSNKKIKTPDTQAMTKKFTADRHRHSTTDRRAAGNMGFANMAGTVGKSTVVHLINFVAVGQFSSFNPPHRKAPNR